MLLVNVKNFNSETDLRFHARQINALAVLPSYETSRIIMKNNFYIITLINQHVQTYLYFHHHNWGHLRSITSLDKLIYNYNNKTNT